MKMHNGQLHNGWHADPPAGLEMPRVETKHKFQLGQQVA